MAGKGFFGNDDKPEKTSDESLDYSEDKDYEDHQKDGNLETLGDSGNLENAETKEKAGGFFDEMKKEKDSIDKGTSKNIIEFLKNIFKSPTGDDKPPETSEALEKKSKNKIVAIAGVFLLVLFGVKTYFEDDPASHINKKIESPDSGSTSLFGNYNLAVGAIKGQVVTNKDVKKQIDLATEKMHTEMNNLREENQKLRRKEIVIAQGSINHNSNIDNPLASIDQNNPLASIDQNNPSANGNLVVPKLPPVAENTIIAPSPPSSLNPMSMTRSNNSYPIVGQSSSAPTGRSDFGVSGEKVYSYSPVTDAVKGVAGAVKDSFNGTGTQQGLAGGVNSSDPVAIVPASTIVAGVMLSGLDAPTGKGSSGNPMPVVMQLMDNGTTASFFQVPIKGCRIILAGYGDLPSERVYMRLERLVCIAETGEVYSASANGVVLGEDGKNGMRGKVVDKQGALILRSMLAGMVQGAGDVFQTLQQQTLASAATGIVTSGGLRGGDLGRSAIGGGLSKSSKKLADFYMKKAEALYPIIEINAGRDVEVLFTRDLQFFPISKIIGKSPESTGSSGGYWDVPIATQQ